MRYFNPKSLLKKLASYIPIEYLCWGFEYIRIERLKKKIGKIGNGCVIGQKFFVEDSGRLVIQDNVSLARNVRIMGIGGVLIKSNTMIASGVTILTTTHDSRAVKMKGTGIHKAVSIGKGVWIGTNAIILPGVTIHDNALVGAGAIVTKDIQEGEVVVGSYAKVIRKRPF